MSYIHNILYGISIIFVCVDFVHFQLPLIDLDAQTNLPNRNDYKVRKVAESDIRFSNYPPYPNQNLGQYYKVS